MGVIEDIFFSLNEMTFEGQLRVERIRKFGIPLCGLIAFVIGYQQQSLKLAAWIVVAFSMLIFLLFVPSWGFNNISPIEFLPSVPVQSAEGGKEEKKESKKNK